jgi:hypothetical protein
MQLPSPKSVNRRRERLVMPVILTTPEGSGVGCLVAGRDRGRGSAASAAA